MSNPFRLEVRVNGTVFCLAGMPEPGTLQATVQVLAGLGHRWGKSQPEPNKPNCSLDISGMTQRDDPLRWQQTNLVPGDEIVMRVLPPGDADLPKVDCRETSFDSFDSDPSDRLRLDFRLNDIKLCIAGMPTQGVLEATLEVCNWAVGYQTDGTPIQPNAPNCCLRIGGLTQRDETLKWMHVELAPLDTVTMTVLPPGASDKPMYRYDVGVHQLPCDWRLWDKPDGKDSGTSDA